MPSQKILLADDEEPVREVVRPMLEYGGYAVEEASNGHETIELVREVEPDMVLLDLNMPDMDGYTVLLKLKSHLQRHNIPVICLSGKFVGDEYEKHSRAFGAIHHLEKPIGRRDLLAAVDEAFLQCEDQPGTDE